MANLPIPLGWTKPDAKLLPANASTAEAIDYWAGQVPSMLPGWLLTALAISLGGPFWFDLLSKLSNIRGAGPRPARADADADAEASS